MKYILVLLTISMFLTGCGEPAKKTIVLQPLGNFSTTEAKNVLQEIKVINPNVTLRKAIPFPSSSYYKPRNRYRADTTIKILKHKIGSDSVIVGLAHKDISTTKNKIKDWGIMGLGYRPGNACIVSSYRLAEKNRSAQFYKVVLHELGHTEGLPHCKVKTCFMRDAEGGNPLDDENSFCSDCKKFLRSKGWSIL